MGAAVRILTGGGSWKWRGRFASDPERLGSLISTKDVTVTIVTAGAHSEGHAAERALREGRGVGSAGEAWLLLGGARGIGTFRRASPSSAPVNASAPKSWGSYGKRAPCQLCVRDIPL
jgi:hypothetical protein